MKISVIVPLYNKSETIGRTLYSVLAQTFLPFEIIIVNDGSTDGSEELAKKIVSPLIKVVTQANSGVSAARNQGIELAQGEWIAFLDADDEWMPEYLSTLKYLSEKYPDCSILGTKYFIQKPGGERSEIILNKMPFSSQDGKLANYFKVSSFSHPPLWTSAVAVKKDAIRSINGFPVGINSGEDLLTWARLAAKFRIAYSIKPLSVFILEDRISRTPQIPDLVSDGLQDLLRTTNVNEIRKYISSWHKMRAKGYLDLGYRRKAFNEILSSLKWNIFSRAWFFVPFLILSTKTFRKAAKKFEKSNK